MKTSRIREQQLEKRVELEKRRLTKAQESVESRLDSQRAQLAQAKALLQLRQQELDALTVRAGISGVLQEVPVEVGERVQPGTVLARVAKPDELKAELRIAETQAKDIQIGLPAEIDTRNGVIAGKVSRIDPAVQDGTVTVDVELTGELPQGARPDLSVDGTIQIERLDDVLYVGRPTYGQANSRVELFKLIDDGQDGRAGAGPARARLGRHDRDRRGPERGGFGHPVRHLPVRRRGQDPPRVSWIGPGVLCEDTRKRNRDPLKPPAGGNRNGE